VIPKTFNLPLSQEASNVFGYIYEGLINQNGNGELEPALAESWEFAPDKKRIIFTLRDGLKWSDGQPLTVDDVVFTYNDIYLNENIPTDIRDILRIGTVAPCLVSENWMSGGLSSRFRSLLPPSCATQEDCRFYQPMRCANP
jgi:ABC-type transport system substrate-binding protein